MAHAKIFIFNKFVNILAGASLLILWGCGSGTKNNGNFPSDFGSLSDAGKVAYVMKHASPDSVARFVCDAALGRISGVSLDFANASLYVAENYRTSDQEAYFIEYARYVDAQPLADRMRLYKLSGESDPQGLGYRLGLDYMRSIRDKKMNAEQVEKELKAFKQACGSDMETYHRFIVGFRTVLKMDHGKDLPEDIYSRFINYE